YNHGMSKLDVERPVARLLAVLLALSVAGVARSQDDPSPADQYRSLLKEFQTVSSAGRVLTDDERLQVVGRTYRIRSQLARRFVELAEKYPRDPIALDALMQAVRQVNGTPWPVDLVGVDEAQERALELLARDHFQSEKLGLVCRQISFGFRREYETFLRAVL